MWASPTVRGVPGNAAQGPARGEAGLWAATPPAPPAQAVMMDEEEAELGAAVELRGLPPDVPDELLTLYFENRRSSGGGPVSSWQRLGRGGILTFQEAADAARVLAQEEHTLHGARLSLRPAPPRARSRLLLQGLSAGMGPQRLEQYVQALLCAAGQPGQPCRALASPRPDRALVQLPKPLSEAEARVLEEHAQALGLEGAEVSLAWVPQARAVRVVGGNPPADLLLLELYLENERRSGGGPLEGVRSLPGHLGTIASFRQWQVAERVLQRAHQLQGSELSLVPHYDVLEPEELSEHTSGGDRLAGLGPGAPRRALLEAGGPARAQNCAGNVTLGSEEAPGQTGASLRTGPLWDRSSLGQASPVSSGPMGSSEQGALVSPGPPGSPGPVEIAVESLEQVASMSLGPVGSPGQEGLVETVLPMELGAMRFIQRYHEDLLAGLGDVALFPLEGSDTTGFRLCGALAPCQAAEEFLQSLLGSVSCHVLSLKHPGSARFLLSPEGQHLLRGLEAQFQCVFGTERLARAALDTDLGEVDPTEALQALPGHSHTLWPPDNTDSDQENMSLEEVRELLAALEGLDGEDWLPLELGEEEPEGQPEEEKTPRAGEGPVAPSTGAPGRLEEEAELQLALYRSLEPQGQVAEREEAVALQRALALSLLEPPPLEEEQELRGGAPGSWAQLEVHATFEQDMDELDRTLEAALEVHLREETVGPQGCVLPAELCARLERRHGVSVALRGDRTVLRGFGTQPTRAARHLAALQAGPWDQSLAFPSVASGPTLPQQRPREPLGRLECVAESSSEFHTVVQAFCDTLDAAHGRICVVQVERVLHPLLQQQYELHRERLEQCCDRRPAEQVLYHGTSVATVPDICAHGFNRSFCGRNGTLYGQGVYFAKRASLAVLDRYSPPDAEGHKAVFVARVLTGDYGQGRRGLRAPPSRPPGHALLRYDSAVDCLPRPGIFVIFHDTQALPTHLITCKHMSRSPLGEAPGLLSNSPAT
ncbi:protein mono-ADP-ribosyltransferase PARP10 isoform X3 [Physeter macrocephalus]|uniref:Poly [ADP-ribose] polymerase n=1 Tax=Physeter macrocephalus TaxID=9755 RepID=A0A2Y9FBZ4_PHYMC|nr:protein mono-ADP-ribosyltransferase PARP10 isoform X3 [Physeter catodon]|eukprot:XP_007118251.3 protein mono-ADP-ribosyltransferase PARP10 isoform X3 [Physeter catodon]